MTKLEEFKAALAAALVAVDDAYAAEDAELKYQGEKQDD